MGTRCAAMMVLVNRSTVFCFFQGTLLLQLWNSTTTSQARSRQRRVSFPQEKRRALFSVARAGNVAAQRGLWRENVDPCFHLSTSTTGVARSLITSSVGVIDVVRQGHGHQTGAFLMGHYVLKRITPLIRKISILPSKRSVISTYQRYDL